MEDEIMERIERSKPDRKDDDLTEIVKRGESIHKTSPGSAHNDKGIEIKEINTTSESPDSRSVACSGNYVSYIDSKSRVVILKYNTVFLEMSFERDVAALGIYEDGEIFMTIVFCDSSAAVYTINPKSLQADVHIEFQNNVCQVEKIGRDFYVVAQQENHFQICKYSRRAYLSEVTYSVVSDNIVALSAPKLLVFDSSLYFIKSSVLHNMKKELMKVSCRDALAVGEFLFVIDTRKKKEGSLFIQQRPSLCT